MRWLLLAALAACGGTLILSSVRPENSGATCPENLFVGETLHKSLWWECDLGQQGREGGLNGGMCQTALEATVRCEGVECVSKVEVDPRSGYSGARRITIELETAGPLRAFVDLAHKGGFHETYLAAECEVLPKPALTLGCEVRDPSTGSFEPCPSQIPLGWEIHLAASVGYTSGNGPYPVVLLDDKELDHKECRNPEGKDWAKTRRCVITSTVGVHRVVAKVKEKFENAIQFEVVGVGPGGR